MYLLNALIANAMDKASKDHPASPAAFTMAVATQFALMPMALTAQALQVAREVNTKGQEAGE